MCFSPFHFGEYDLTLSQKDPSASCRVDNEINIIIE